MQRILRNTLDLLGAALVVAAGVFALYYWDPTRADIKRFLSDDRYLYEEVEPRLLSQDQTDFIQIRDAGTASRVREKVIDVIWGPDGLPTQDLPDTVARDIDKRTEVPRKCRERQYSETDLRLACEVPKYRDWDNLAGVDELIFSFGGVYAASVGYFRPKRGNGVLVIYQHGFAGTYHAQRVYLERLVAAGYTVAANNMDRYGDNVCGSHEALKWCGPSAGNFSVPLPLRIYFSPIVKTINYALDKGDVRHVVVIGFSGGAWISAVMASVDTRIERSYPVAGVMPFHMRREKEWPPNQVYPPLLDTAGMLDLFVMGASGPGRRQVQFFNRFDRCCYNGPRPLLYQKSVRQTVGRLGPGYFSVLMDETHARHKISQWTFSRIIADLQVPWN